MPWSKTTDVGKSETVVDSKGKYEKKLDCLLHDCVMQEKMCKNILSVTNRFSINNIMGKWKYELDKLI